MYDKTTLSMLEQIYLHPGIHKRELSRQIGIGMPSIDHALKKIVKLVKTEKTGNQHRFSLDYSKEGLSPMLSAVEYARWERLPEKVRRSLSDFLKALEEKPMMVLVFGSYAKGTATKSSDIDLFLVFQSMDHPERIEQAAKKVSMKTGTRLNPVYLDYQTFKESFHDPTKAFFKKLREAKIILEGMEWWRQLEDEEA